VKTPSDTVRLRDELDAGKGSWLPVLLSFALILSITVLICDLLNTFQRKQIDLAFARDTQRVVVQMESQLRSHFEALLGVRGLYAAKAEVSRKDFQLFLGELNLKNNHPGFQAIQFVRHVPGAQLAEFVDGVRHDASLQPQGYPQFNIHPDVARPDHYVIEFTEPMQGNEKAFGFDLASLPAHLAALELGRDTGRAVATERVKLVQDSVAQAAIVVRIPIYRNGLPQDTVEQRRAALLGFAALVYRIDDLMREVIDPQLLSSMRTRIYDAGYEGTSAPIAHDAHNLLFDSDASVDSSGVAGSGELALASHGSLVVGQRAWAFDFVGKEGGRYSRDYALIGAILASGTVIAALFATLVAAWARRRRLSARLARTVAEQKAIFDNATVGIELIKDRVIQACNVGMAEMLGYRTDELIGASTRKLLASDEVFDTLGKEAYETMVTGQSWIGEVQWIRKDGRPIVCRLHGKYVDANNLELGSIWVSYDITAQKKADAALQEANASLQASLAQIEQRTRALSESHAELSAAYEAAEMSRQRAEEAQRQATQALAELRTAESQLIQSEKMASLGQLVANVAHEINTPIAAVKSSGESISDALEHLEDSTLAFVALDLPTRSLFAQLMGHAKSRSEVLSSREERVIVRGLAAELEQANIVDASRWASLLVQLNAQAVFADYLPLLRHPESALIMSRAYNMATVINSATNINTAVDRVTKIVFALKAYSRVDSSGEMVHVPLREGIDTVLTIYQNKIKQGTELVRHFEDIPTVCCLPDELNQVWTNLIHNALQAMDYKGTLTINIGRVGDEAVVSVGDTGCGIPEAIRPKIFDPFFTTKASGEGSGLGLDIVKKIVDKHKGRIEVHSEVGVGTTFSVFLPFEARVV